MLSSVPGCGMSGGKMLWAMGFGKAPKIPAQFVLTQGPLLVFVDDIHDRVDWPQAKSYLFEEVSQALLANGAAAKIVPPEMIDQLRQTLPEFNKRGCREIGEMVGAEQVLWLDVVDFHAEEQFEEASKAAIWSVRVKVINVLEKEQRLRVRLWPQNPDGETLTAELSAAVVSVAKTKDGASKKLAERLGGDVARLFYEHRADEGA